MCGETGLCLEEIHVCVCREQDVGCAGRNEVIWRCVSGGRAGDVCVKGETGVCLFVCMENGVLVCGCAQWIDWRCG